MNVCCHGLQNLLSFAGERGISAVVWVDSSGEYRLRMQSRGMSYEDSQKFATGEVKMSFEPEHSDIVINYSRTMGFLYCMFCGKAIEATVKANHDFFRNLFLEHAKYSE